MLLPSAHEPSSFWHQVDVTSSRASRTEMRRAINWPNFRLPASLAEPGQNGLGPMQTGNFAARIPLPATESNETVRIPKYFPQK